MYNKEIIHFIKSIYKNQSPVFLHNPIFIGNEKEILKCAKNIQWDILGFCFSCIRLYLGPCTLLLKYFGIKYIMPTLAG